MKMPLSTNPVCRSLTLPLVIEEHGSVVNWMKYLKENTKMNDKELIAYCVKRGFLDEEIEGALISLR